MIFCLLASLFKSSTLSSLLIILSSDGGTCSPLEPFLVWKQILWFSVYDTFLCRNAYNFLYNSHSYNHSRIYAEAQLHFLHRCCLSVGSSLGCRAEIRTRACLKASRRSTGSMVSIFLLNEMYKNEKPQDLLGSPLQNHISVTD